MLLYLLLLLLLLLSLSSLLSFSFVFSDDCGAFTIIDRDGTIGTGTLSGINDALFSLNNKEEVKEEDGFSVVFFAY